MARAARIVPLSANLSRERAARLYKLVQTLAQHSQTRGQLIRRLRVGMRTFYRDLDLLRECRIDIDLDGQKYTLRGTLSGVLERLPFPNPELSFAEAALLAKGRSKANQKIRAMLLAMTR